ncbi:hypothetical protein GCM10023212_18010 [Luteolibacter yonseiensis]|nr:hypothetical protein [Luteolibacter yonseiensis]
MKASEGIIWWKPGGASLWIAIGMHALLLIVAMLCVRSIRETPEARVDFVARGKGDDDGGGGGRTYSIVKQKQTAVFSKASAPRVAALDVKSNVVLPLPEDGAGITHLPAVGFSSLSGGLGGSGHGGGKGAGVGNGFGPGIGNGGGLALPTARFFDLEVKAKRIAYVIDFSKSMKGKRQQLMRTELVKSIGQLDPTQDYQLIFFAGPVWLGGSVVRMADDQKSAVVIDNQGTEHRWTSINIGNWEMSGRRQQAPWLRAGAENIRQSIETVRKTELEFGTYWKPAIELALGMQPAPEVIYFMTDGIVSKKVYETIDELSRTARRRSTVINTISMMEPDAADAMRALAKQSGGAFTQISADGTSVVSNFKN